MSNEMRHYISIVEELSNTQTYALSAYESKIQPTLKKHYPIFLEQVSSPKMSKKYDDPGISVDLYITDEQVNYQPPMPSTLEEPPQEEEFLVYFNIAYVAYHMHDQDRDVYYVILKDGKTHDTEEFMGNPELVDKIEKMIIADQEDY